MTIQCDDCALLAINGIICHEQGCPSRWINPKTGKGYTRACKECGRDFTPEEDHQHFCTDECAAMYNGF